MIAVGGSEARSVFETPILPSDTASSKRVPSGMLVVATSTSTGAAEAAARSSAPLT